MPSRRRWPGPGAARVLYLASSSPRRAALLDAAGVRWRPATPGAEPAASGPPAERARQRARSKACSASVVGPPGWVLGVDTVVARGATEFPKPRDRAHARAMLLALAGGDHEVHTALCLAAHPAAEVLEAAAVARVRCGPLPAAVLDAWLDSGLWRGKAAAYGLQDEGCSFMALIEGRRDTVVGLSVDVLNELLARAGLRGEA